MNRRPAIFVLLTSALFLLTIILLLSGNFVSDTAAFSPVPDVSVPPKDEYLLVLELMPDGSSLDAQFTNAFDQLASHLFTYLQQGQLAGFSPLPELGAILLRSPSGELLGHLEAMPGIRSVLPAAAPESQQVANRFQRLRQEGRQASQFATEHIRPAIDQLAPSVNPAAKDASFVVASTADATDVNPGDGACETAPGNGVCTLRAAIQEANALPGADSIVLASGTYQQTIAGANEDAAATGDFDVTDDLSIYGDPISSTSVRGISVDDRVFHIISGTVSIKNLIVSQGLSLDSKGGGGVLVDAAATVYLDGITVQSNFAIYGGAVAVAGDLTAVNTTISGNSAEMYGAGIFTSGQGLATLENVTVSNNSAANPYGTGGGGGIAGNFVTKNTIVGANYGQYSPDCAGTINSQGHNLIQNTSGCTITGDSTGNLTGVSPSLGPLQDNGGPTPTMALSAISPAVDRGDNAGCPSSDQRGYSRPVDGDSNGSAICDIGAFEYVYSVNLTNLYVNLNESYLDGYLSAPNAPITLTLKTGSTVKDQVTTVASGTYFTVYFASVIEGGDAIQVDLPGQPTEVIAVPPLNVTINKATDVVSGTGPLNHQLNILLYSYAQRQNYYANPVSDGTGSFSADFSGQIDIFTGDEVDIWLIDSSGYQFRIRDERTRGLIVDPLFDGATGYADPGAIVYLTLKDSIGAVKATTTVNSNGNSGWFSADFLEDMVVGDSVEIQYASQPTQTLWVVAATLDTIDPATDIVTGTSPANGKMQVYASDDYTGQRRTLIVSSDGSGQYSVDFSGSVDILAGSVATARLHDSQDNEVYAGRLYAGPYIRANLNYWSDLWVVGRPGEALNAVLRNALGAIKATASGIAGPDGATYLDFYDSTGSSADVLPTDQIEVHYAGGSVRTVDAVAINYVTDREARRVAGSGPPSTTVRLSYNWNSSIADVATSASGYFSHTFSSRLTGGYSMDALYRNPQGDDVRSYGYVPQFTVYPESQYLWGYGPINAAVVANLRDNIGAVIASSSATTDSRGYYWLNFHGVSLVPGDTVSVDVGPLHYEQAIVPLTIAADTSSNIVYGTAPPSAWLNVFAQNWFGPYDAFNYRYFYADTSGHFSAPFSEVRGGDYLRALYWENGYQDRVEIRRYAPFVSINHTADTVDGASSLGAVGDITVRDSGGGVKASGIITSAFPYGNFSFAPNGVNIVPGDEVETVVGSLDQIDPVIPMSGTLALATDRVGGVSLPDIDLGIRLYHWNGSGYTFYDRFERTDASGHFDADYSTVGDLIPGDSFQLYYYVNDTTRYLSSFHTTNPRILVDDYPSAVQPNSLVEVHYTLADGEHPQNTYVRWDTISHEDDNAYSNYSRSQQGVLGKNAVSFIAPSAGSVYFKVYASVDNQAVWSDEYVIGVSGTVATTIYDPVSGTTNDSTPQIRGVSPPGSSVALYQDGVEIITGAADSSGHFTFDIAPPLAQGTYVFHAVASLGGTPGPSSNLVHLTVDPTLKVDPVQILISTRGQTQHIRDAGGYANLGGQIWTRTGDSVGLSIPISYTNIFTADIYVGAVYASPLVDSGNDVYVGTYMPPTGGNYALSIKFRGDGPSGVIHTVNILTGLIDPDGYIYDGEQGPDHRLAGVQVTCYQLSDSKTWAVWNGAIWSQTNPQTTGSDGYYAFFTLPGTYKVVVTAPGYQRYESPDLLVVDAPVHHNVGLRRVRYVYLPAIIRQ